MDHNWEISDTWVDKDNNIRNDWICRGCGVEFTLIPRFTIDHPSKINTESKAWSTGVSTVVQKVLLLTCDETIIQQIMES